MKQFLKTFENVIVTVLIVLMMIVILLATAHLAWMIGDDILSSPAVLLDVRELLGIFSFFLLILIGLELLETIKIYLSDHVVHVEVVLEVALIAVARKLITMETKEFDGTYHLGLAAIILALALAYYLRKRSDPVKEGSQGEQE